MAGWLGRDVGTMHVSQMDSPRYRYRYNDTKYFYESPSEAININIIYHIISHGHDCNGGE